MSSLSARLNTLIEKNGLKPATFAKEIEVNKSTISRILSGDGTPTVDTLYKSANYFNVSMEFLLTGEESCPNATLSFNELDLLTEFRKLTVSDQEEIMHNIHYKNNRMVGRKSITSTNTENESIHKNLA